MRREVTAVPWSLGMMRAWLLLSCLGIGLCNAAMVRAQPATQASLFDQRNLYQQANGHIKAGRIGEYRRLAKSLRDYPLYPYLRYREVRAQVINGTIRDSAFASFLATHRDLPVTRLLHIRWYKKQGSQRRWQPLLDLPLESSNAQVRCYGLRAQYNTGEKDAALRQVAALWTQPKSQPKACDPLFDVWRESSYFNQDLVWERLQRALRKNQRQLARYLVRYTSGATRSLAEQFIAVHQAPRRISRTADFRANTSKQREVITHGLRRLARNDPAAATKAWQILAQKGTFTDEQRRLVETAIALANADDGRFPAADRSSTFNADAIASLSQMAVEQQDWGQIHTWTNRLAERDRAKAQWQYWRSRAATELGPGSQAVQTESRAGAQLLQLAQQRQYYGFLAAQELGLLGQLQDESTSASSVDLNNLKNIPGMHRAIELFAVGDNVNGRREWYAALRIMTEREQVLAARLALELGQTYLAISTANIAEASNHLNLRFPLVHQQQFRAAAHTSGLPTALLIAVARQESAMNRRARSHADARGLMQMLPSTARLVARRAGRSTPSASDLYNPTINIALGSYHLAWLTSRYEGRQELAIAAYNAGEHRVDRWIRDKRGLDIVTWIEQIPFKETRNYVKNVLAFKHVYAQLLGEPRPMLDDKLREIP
ncbi:MAG: transglycosylase SLT domain-containing protein [Pseudomonadota bacterium]